MQHQDGNLSPALHPAKEMSTTEREALGHASSLHHCLAGRTSPRAKDHHDRPLEPCRITDLIRRSAFSADAFVFAGSRVQTSLSRPAFS